MQTPQRGRDTALPVATSQTHPDPSQEEEKSTFENGALHER